MRDTLDLVPIAAFYGKGNRTGMYGSFLMASYNPNSNMFESVCKLGTGFTWSQLQKLKLSPLAEDFDQQKDIAKTIYRTSQLLKPDLWLKPDQIWEIGADSFTLSKTHKCGFDAIREMGPYSGLSLRFPRFIRVRDDKRVQIKVRDYFELHQEYGHQRGTEVGTQVTEILDMYLN